MSKQWALLFLALGIAGCSPPHESGSKPKADGAGPKEEIAKLKGAWSGTLFLRDAPGGDVTVEFTSDTVRVDFKKFDTTEFHPYSIDPTQDPKWMDWKGNPGSDPPMPTIFGIYELNGDNLKLCVGSSRPMKIANKLGTVYTLTRK